MKNAESINLFDCFCGVVTHEQRIARRDSRKKEKGEPSEHRRTHNPAKEHISTSVDVVDDNTVKPVGVAGNGEVKDDSKQENVKSYGESGNNRVAERSKEKGGRRKVKAVDAETISGNDGKRRKGKSGEGDGEVYALNEKILSYPLYEFPEGKCVSPPKQIDIGPVKKDDFVSYIVIEGKRYEVSSWSVKHGVYIQGLDSKYIVSNLTDK